MAETISKGGSSTIQNDVDELINQSVVNKFRMNEGKCKEMRIGFSKLSKPTLTQLKFIRILL